MQCIFLFELSSVGVVHLYHIPFGTMRQTKVFSCHDHLLTILPMSYPKLLSSLRQYYTSIGASVPSEPSCFQSVLEDLLKRLHVLGVHHGVMSPGYIMKPDFAPAEVTPCT